MIGSAPVRRFIWWVLWAIVLLIGIVPAFLREAHTDEAWPLYLAQRVLQGSRHGADFFEMNPPLFVWLSIPAVLIHRISGLLEWHAWVLSVLALTVGCLVLLARILGPLMASSNERRLFLLAAGFIVMVLPRLFFSEREHLSLILVLPYVAIAALRVNENLPPRGTALVSGVLGGAGFSLKPHFLVAWILLEIWLLFRIRSTIVRRAELWALVGFGMVYFLTVLLLVPDYFPMARRLAPIYHTYLNNGFAGAVYLAGPSLLLLVGIAVAIRSVRQTSDPLLDALTVAFVGFLLGAVLQQKGLPYHYLGAWGCGLLMLTRSWQVRPPRLSWYPSGILQRLGYLLLVVTMAQKTSSAIRELLHPSDPRYRSSTEEPDLIRVTRQLASGEPIVVLSTNPVGGWPLTLSAGAQWGSRYMHFWPMAAIYDDQLWQRPSRMVRPRPLAERAGVERRFHDEIVEDMERSRPRLVLVLTPDSTQWGMGGARKFDYLEYFGADPRFRSIMEAYREHSRIGAYQLWTRIEP